MEPILVMVVNALVGIVLMPVVRSLFGAKHSRMVVCASARFVLFFSAAAVATLASASLPADQKTASALQLLEDRRFEELDSRMASLQRGYAAGSVSDLELLGAARDFYTTQPRLEALFSEWVARYPNSYMARLARGIYYKRVGAQDRGDRYAHETTKDRIAAMHVYYKKAMGDFEASLALESKPILSYLYMIDILKYSAPLSIRFWLFKLSIRMDGRGYVLEEANRIAPGNFIVRRKYMLTLQTRWGGSVRAMGAFLEECRTAALSEEQLKVLEAIVVADRAWVKVQRKDFSGAVQDYRTLSALVDFGNAQLFEHGQREMLLHETGYAYQKIRDYRESVRYLSQAIEAGADGHDVYVSRGISHANLGNKKEALHDYLRAAERGNAWAQNEVGVHYWHGIIFGADRREATAWFQRAADQGFAEGQKNLHWARKQCPEC